MNRTETIKMGITIVATLTAITFITLSSLFPTYAVLLLSVEVILLPAIYIIGSTLVENLLREQHEKNLEAADRKFRILDEKYYKLAHEYYVLRRKDGKGKTDRRLR